MQLLMTVPFTEEPNRLGAAYNEIMRETTTEWVGFVDHDVWLAAQPEWWSMIRRAIDEVPRSVAWIGCVTNRIGCPLQRVRGVDPRNHEMHYHRQIARREYEQHGHELRDVTGSRFSLSALVFAVRRDAWLDVGGFRETGWLGVDTDFCGRLRRRHWRIVLLPGLYVYHWYRAAEAQNDASDRATMGRTITA